MNDAPTPEQFVDIYAEAVKSEGFKAMQKEIAKLEDENAKLSAWKQAVIEKLVVSHCYKNAHEDDPEAAVNDLISWEVDVASGSSSSAAAALVRTAVDCRTCRKASRHGHRCMSTAQCVNGDQYVSVHPVQLWRKK